MKRDIDLARQILLQTEGKASYGRRFVELDFRDLPKQILSEHVKLLTEAGLIESRINPREATLLPIRLSWQGHEFLDAAKSETIWQKTKKLVQEKGGALTFDVAKAILAQVALKQVGL